MTARTVDLCLDEIERLRQARDRAVAQRVAMESALWHAEWLLKKVVDGTRIDVTEIQAFLLEKRHHPTDVASPAGMVGTNRSHSRGPGGRGDTDEGHVDV